MDATDSSINNDPLTICEKYYTLNGDIPYLEFEHLNTGVENCPISHYAVEIIES